MKKNKEITITIKFNPETAKLQDILAECKQKVLDSLPYISLQTMSQANVKTTQEARNEMRKLNIHLPYYIQQVNVFNGLLSYVFNADGVKTIPAEQRENATKVMQSLQNQNILLLSRLDKRIHAFKDKSIHDETEYVYPNKLPYNLITKQEMKKMIVTIISSKNTANDNGILAKHINSLCLSFMPKSNTAIKIAKTPAPKNSYIDPYTHTRREFYDKNITRTYIEGMLAGIKDIQKKYKK